MSISFKEKYYLMHKDRKVVLFDFSGNVNILNKKLVLYKHGNVNEVKNEVLASKIISCFKVDAVNYKLDTYKKTSFKMRYYN